VNPENL